MKKTGTIIASIVAFILIGGLIIVWAVYLTNEGVKKSHLVKSFNDDNFETDVLIASTRFPILVDFYADWCIPCRILGPIIEEVAKELEGKAIIGKVNTDKNLISRRLGIRRLPTVWIIRDGRLKETFYGVVPKEKILQALREHGPANLSGNP